jgi:BirA family transcriptional regulator, biotin operon repressor / biotin---[acetyl-CoA-carboxylase] ligase
MPPSGQARDTQSGTNQPHRPVRLLEFDQLPSTNAYALAHLSELHHGDVVIARIQTAGRGRLDRTWISHHPGNAALSIILKPSKAALLQPAITHYLAVVLCQTIEMDGVKPSIKWPNDVQVGGCKIAGILAEARMDGQRFLGMALGLGVNLNLSPALLAAVDQPATALNLLLGRPVDRDGFIRNLLNRFFEGLDAFLRGGFKSVRHDYEHRAAFLGQFITVRQLTGAISGMARSIDVDGALLLETEDGGQHLLRAGDLIAPPCPGSRG